MVLARLTQQQVNYLNLIELLLKYQILEVMDKFVGGGNIGTIAASIYTGNNFKFAVDESNGNLYISEMVAGVIRKLDWYTGNLRHQTNIFNILKGVTSVVLGTYGGRKTTRAEGVATTVATYGHTGCRFDIAVSGSTLYHLENSAIRKVVIGGSTSVFAGSASVTGYVNGALTTARYTSLSGLATDSTGKAFTVESSSNKVVRLADTAGI